MKHVDHFAVNALKDAEHPSLRRIGWILYDCDGTLTESQVDEIAVLLKDFAQNFGGDRE